jgi:imidazolonepropionase-like amidohydrolase
MAVFGECHAHIFMDGIDYRAAAAAHRNHPDERLIREHLAAYSRRGITFIREGGDRYGASEIAARAAADYGITYISPVFAIHKNGCYGGIVGLGFDTMKEYHELVLAAIQKGADFIKIMTTGIMDFQTDHTVTGTPLSADEVREMVHIAHEEGCRVMSHTNTAQAVIDACRAGVDSIEHGNFQNEESLSAMAEEDTVFVPTVVTVRNLIGSGLFDDQVMNSIWEGQQQMVSRARALGVSMALGSDAGAKGVLHGQGIEDEYQAFKDIFPEDDSLDAYLLAGENRIRAFVREDRK